jgi:hypothetical protein
MRAGSHYARTVRVYARIELGDSEAIDLFLREEDARRALEECRSDEPNSAGLVYVAGRLRKQSRPLRVFGASPCRAPAASDSAVRNIPLRSQIEQGGYPKPMRQPHG